MGERKCGDGAGARTKEKIPLGAIEKRGGCRTGTVGEVKSIQKAGKNVKITVKNVGRHGQLR